MRIRCVCVAVPSVSIVEVHGVVLISVERVVKVVVEDQLLV